MADQVRRIQLVYDASRPNEQTAIIIAEGIVYGDGPVLFGHPFPRVTGEFATLERLEEWLSEMPAITIRWPDSPVPGIPPGTDLGRLRAWEADGKPALMATLEYNSIASIAGMGLDPGSHILDQWPEIDIWMIAHQRKPRVEETVAGLRAAGKIVVRRLDMLSARESNVFEPSGNWARTVVWAMDADGCVKMPDDFTPHFRWFGRGRILDWSRLSQDAESHALDLLESCSGFFALKEQQHNVWEFDLVFQELYNYLLLEGEEAHESGEAPEGGPIISPEMINQQCPPEAWRANLLSFMRGHLERTRGAGYTNGDLADPDGAIARMWEAANERQSAAWEGIVTEWAGRYGNVLEIRSPKHGSAPTVHQLGMDAIRRWVGVGGILWCDNWWHPYHPDYSDGSVTAMQRAAIGARG